MKRQHQTEMTVPGFDCFALIQDVIANPWQQQAERDAAKRIIEQLQRAQTELPIIETNAVNAG